MAGAVPKAYKPDYRFLANVAGEIERRRSAARRACFDHMLHDFRYALRTQRQNPGFALVAILSLALGVGANSAIFSFADALILRPLPVSDASGVVTVRAKMRGECIAKFSAFYPLSYPDYIDLRARSKSFAALTAATFSSFGFAPAEGVLPQMKFGELVS